MGSKVYSEVGGNDSNFFATSLQPSRRKARVTKCLQNGHFTISVRSHQNARASAPAQCGRMNQSSAYSTHIARVCRGERTITDSPVLSALPGHVHGSTQTKSFPASVHTTHRDN